MGRRLEPHEAYPDCIIPSRRAHIKKECRLCGGSNNLIYQNGSGDWWHTQCLTSVPKVTDEEVNAHFKAQEKKPKGYFRNYKYPPKKQDRLSPE